MILRNGQREAVFRNGLDLQNDFYKESLQLRYVQRDIISSQLNFNCDLPGSWGKVNGGLGYNETQRDEPDTRRIVYQRDSQDASSQMQAVVTPSAQPFFLGRLFMNLSETSRAVHGAYTLDLIRGNDDKQPIWNVSAGVYHQYKSRSFSIRNLGYKSSSQFNFDLTNLPVTEILDNQNIYHPGGFLPAENTKPSDQYSASNELTSFFGKMSYNDRPAVIAAVREAPRLYNENGDPLELRPHSGPSIGFLNQVDAQVVAQLQQETVAQQAMVVYAPSPPAVEIIELPVMEVKMEKVKVKKKSFTSSKPKERRARSPMKKTLHGLRISKARLTKSVEQVLRKMSRLRNKRNSLIDDDEDIDTATILRAEIEWKLTQLRVKLKKKQTKLAETAGKIEKIADVLDLLDD